MRPRRNIRPPRRYEDELDAFTSSPKNSMTTASRRVLRDTISAFDIPSIPFNPTLVRERPAAFPSRDVTMNWGLIELQNRNSKKQPRHDKQSSDTQDIEQDVPMDSVCETPQPQQDSGTEEIRRLTSRNRSLRAILPVSRRRSDAAVKLPKKKSLEIPTIRRRQPNPNHDLGNNVPYFSELESSGPRLEEVWDALGRNAPSFLNQPIDTPRHGLRDCIIDLKLTHAISIPRIKPLSRPSIPVVVRSRVASRANRPVSREAPGSVPGRRSSFLDKPLKLAKMGPHDKARWRKRYGSTYPVDTQNGPFYNPEFADEDFLVEAESSGNGLSRPFTTFGGLPIIHFDELVAQVAIDVYCQLYFEAQALGVDGKMICRNLLDLTTEADEHMRWVIAKRLLDKIVDSSILSIIPSIDLDREVRPGSSPLVSSFKNPEHPPHLARHLARKDVDWDYVATSDLEKAQTFLRTHKLPSSLLSDWTGEQPLPQTSSSHQAKPVNQPDTDGAPKPPTSRPNRRRKRSTHSDSEYHDENDGDETNELQKLASNPVPTVPADRPKQHVPPRPSFARPGVSVAYTAQGGNSWRAQLALAAKGKGDTDKVNGGRKRETEKD